MEYNKSKYPMLLLRDFQALLMEYIHSDECNQYLEQTVFTSDEARQAFQSGMLWAGLLANKCYQFGDIMISEEELTHYVNKIATERANK